MHCIWDSEGRLKLLRTLVKQENGMGDRARQFKVTSSKMWLHISMSYPRAVFMASATSLLFHIVVERLLGESESSDK